jgi:pyruvate formate lyase activating enzyme
MGGEPTVAKELGEMLMFAKNELGAETRLGHTNGNRLDFEHLDGANVGFKAWSEERHKEITGRLKALIYDNFSRAFNAGLNLSANMVFVPELTGLDELEGLVRFLGRLDPDIPFHIMGYIPVPGQNWRRPRNEEMDAALLMARSFLNNVDSSHLSSAEALDLTSRDDRFKVSVIAGK